MIIEWVLTGFLSKVLWPWASHGMNTYPAVVLVLMISIYLTSHLEKKPASLSHTYKEQSRIFEHVRLSLYALPIFETYAVLIHTHIFAMYKYISSVM